MTASVHAVLQIATTLLGTPVRSCAGIRLVRWYVCAICSPSFRMRVASRYKTMPFSVTVIWSTVLVSVNVDILVSFMLMCKLQLL